MSFVDPSTLLLPYRQGDVLLIPCAGIPAGAKEEAPEHGRVILARGEVTGHSHAMMAERVRFFRDDGLGRAFVQVSGDAPVDLEHEEHAPLGIPPGSYRLVRQREYLPQEDPRAVID